VTAGPVEGSAVVLTRTGRAYVGRAHLASGVVTMPAARLRIRNIGGDRLYEPAPRSWSPSEWREIRWADVEAVA